MYEALRRGSTQATPQQHAQIYAAQIIEVDPKKASIFASSGWIRLLSLGAGAVLVGAVGASAYFNFKQLPVQSENTQQLLRPQQASTGGEKQDSKLAQVSENRDAPLVVAANSKLQPPMDVIATKQFEQSKVIELGRDDAKAVAAQVIQKPQVISSEGRKGGRDFPLDARTPRESVAARSSEVSKIGSTREVIATLPNPSQKPANTESLNAKTIQDISASSVQAAATTTKSQSTAASSSPAIQKISAVESVNLADLFDSMNREIAKGNLAEATKYLQSIQATLPASSISRMRAEGWYDLHQGNFDSARSAYRKIIAKIPSDEHALSVLQSIDRKAAASNTQAK